MLIRWTLRLGLIGLSVLCIDKVASQTWLVEHRAGLLDTAQVVSELVPCSAILISSRAQCSNCGKAGVEIMELCEQRGYEVVFARVVDAAWQTCKEDELAFLTHFPEGKFLYLDEMQMNYLYPTAKLGDKFGFDSTPALLLFNREKVKTYTTDELTDSYGRRLLLSKAVPKCRMK